MVKLAGYEAVGTYNPDQLYAGEADIVTTQGVIEAAAAAMEDNTAVALVGGYLVPFDAAGVDGSEKLHGVIPHAIDNSEGATDVDTPVIVGGVLNFDVIEAGGATYAELQAAASGTNIVIQKLY